MEERREVLARIADVEAFSDWHSISSCLLDSEVAAGSQIPGILSIQTKQLVLGNLSLGVSPRRLLVGAGTLRQLAADRSPCGVVRPMCRERKELPVTLHLLTSSPLGATAMTDNYYGASSPVWQSSTPPQLQILCSCV